jgi:iron complex outermembrane receptor protein
VCARLSSALILLCATVGWADSPEDGGVEAPPAFTPEEALVEFAAVGSRLVQTTQATPASVMVISGEQLLRAGYRSVAEALATLPGIFVSDDLQNSHVAVRGIFGGARAGSRTIRVLVDGVPVTFTQSGINLLGPELMPLSAIERIEVLKGPASALYGTGALAGAVNIVTRRPAYEGEVTFGLDARARGGVGGQRGGGGELSATLTGQRFSLLLGLSGDFLDRSGLTVADGPFAAKYAPVGVSVRDTSIPLTGLFRGDASLLGGRLSALFVGQLSNRAAEFHDLSVLTHNTRIALYNLTANLQFERPFANGIALLARFGGNLGGPQQGDQYDFGSASTFFLQRRYSSQSLNASLEGRYDTDAGGSLVVGGEWNRELDRLPAYVEVDKVSGAQTARPVPQLRGITNLAAYLTGQYPVTSWFSVAGGLRYDHNTAVGSMFGARVGVVFPIEERASIKLLFGRSHRAPSPEQLYGVPATFLDVQGQETLLPQYLTGGEAVADIFLTRWLNLSLNGFANRLENNLAYLARGNQLVATPYNATQVGGEALLRMAVTLNEAFALDGSGAFSFQNTATDQSVIAGFLQKDVPDNEAVPTVIGSGTLGLRYLPLKASVSVEYRYVGQRTPSQTNLRLAGTADMDKPNYLLAAYHLLNASVGISPVSFGPSRELSFLVRITNLLNARWSEIGFNGVDVPSLGTTAWLTARVTL